MITIKDNEIYNGNDELIGSLNLQGKTLVWIPELFRCYTLEELEHLVKHMLGIRDGEDRKHSTSRGKDSGDIRG